MTVDAKSVTLGVAVAIGVPLTWLWVKRHSNTQVHRINQ